MAKTTSLAGDLINVKLEDVESMAGSLASEPGPRRSRRVRKPTHAESTGFSSSPVKGEKAAGKARSRMKAEEEVDTKQIKIEREDKKIALAGMSPSLRAERMAPIQAKMDEKFGPDIKAPTDELQLTPVSRAFLSSYLGGNMQAGMTPPSKRPEILDGVKMFCYPMPNWNPEAPTEPMQRGFVYIETDYLNKPVRLFIRKRTGWLYCGDYVLQLCKPLSPEEWMSQREEVRNTWVSKRFGKDWHSERHTDKVQKKLATYLVQRRRDERLDRRRYEEPRLAYHPTALEIEDCIRSGEIDMVTPDLVRTDLEEGRMFVPVRGLCLDSYKPAFQPRLVKEFRSWREEQRNRNNNQAAPAKRNARPKGVLRRKKRSNAATLARESIMGIDSDSEEEAPAPLPIRSSNNKKRPRAEPASQSATESSSEEPERKRKRTYPSRSKLVPYVDVPLRKSRLSQTASSPDL